ncbi:MAG: hypothetical protein GF375_00920 [Candidatus Omnitrophica bacterium]|nr:hypothetical protein [Candidatus Omnitrophota bacterium]
MKEINNIRNGENTLVFGQTSKGQLYLKEMTIVCYSIIDGIELSERALDKILKILEEKNKNNKGD